MTTAFFWDFVPGYVFYSLNLVSVNVFFISSCHVAHSWRCIAMETMNIAIWAVAFGTTMWQLNVVRIYEPSFIWQQPWLLVWHTHPFNLFINSINTLYWQCFVDFSLVTESKHNYTLYKEHTSPFTDCYHWTQTVKSTIDTISGNEQNNYFKRLYITVIDHRGGKLKGTEHLISRILKKSALQIPWWTLHWPVHPFTFEYGPVS